MGIWDDARPTSRGEPLLAWLDSLEVEALERIDPLGGTVGKVTEAQRPWSVVLDLVAHEREAA